MAKIWSLANGPPLVRECFGGYLEPALPTFQRHLLYQPSTTRRDYSVCSDWYYRRRLRNCVLMTGNWLATSSDCGRPTQWKCATARVCTCAVRNKYSLQTRFFFVRQCANVYRLTPKHQQAVHKWSIVMTEVSFWNWSVRKKWQRSRSLVAGGSNPPYTSTHTRPTSSVLIPCYGFFSLALTMQCCSAVR
jgi:hypothetical protein